jgi:hypothetical protein
MGCKPNTRSESAHGREQQVLLPGSLQDWGLVSASSRQQQRKTTMKTYRMIGLGLAAGLALATVNANAQIKNAPAGTMVKADQNFMNEAIEGDLSEINMGKLAQQKGQSQGTK